MIFKILTLLVIPTFFKYSFMQPKN